MIENTNHCSGEACAKTQGAVMVARKRDEEVPRCNSGIQDLAYKRNTAIRRSGAKRVVEPEVERCSICLGEYEPNQETVLIECLHKFHQECIDGWLSCRQNCPLCRHYLKSMQPLES